MSNIAPSTASNAACCGCAMTFSANEALAGGARRNRTDDLLLAKQALSQLSYGPVAATHICYLLPDLCHLMWWVWMDSNHRPPPYQDGALTN